MLVLESSNLYKNISNREFAFGLMLFISENKISFSEDLRN